MVEVDERWKGPCPCGAGKVFCTFTDYMKGYGGDKETWTTCLQCDEVYSFKHVQEMLHSEMTARHKVTGQVLKLVRDPREAQRHR